MDSDMIRYAIIFGNADSVSAYLPNNYSVLWHGWHSVEGYGAAPRECTVIEGTDTAGWTLDDYVLPRLASGLYFGHEVDLSHPIMKVIPA